MQRFRTGKLDKAKLFVEINPINREMKIVSYGTENISYHMRPTLICSDPLQSSQESLTDDWRTHVRDQVEVYQSEISELGVLIVEIIS